MSAASASTGQAATSGGSTSSGATNATTGQTTTAAAAAAGGGGDEDAAEVLNADLANYLYIICGAMAAAILLWRVGYVVVRRLRTMSALHSDTQRYFAAESWKFAWTKRELVYAPVSRKRHNREMQLSSAVNIGTLPTRLQLVFLAGYVGVNIAYSVMDISFSSSSAASTLRNRTGVLATVNMVPLFLMAGRNNPLINLLGMSFDTFNLLHRWFGRIVALEALAHTLAWLIPQAQKADFGTAFAKIFASQFYLYGFIGTAAFLALITQACSPLRHAFYETFKIMHIALAAVSVMGLYYHLNIGQYDEIKYVYGVIGVWSFDRAARYARIIYHNIGSGGTRTLVEALPGGACRLTVTLARPWTFKPGQHAYLYIPSVGYWQSHPFSVAWSAEAEALEEDKLAMNRQEVLGMTKTTMSFVIRGRTGMTGKLYKKASEMTDGRYETKCFVEGPYGGFHNMHSYGTVMLFAGGVGITQAVPHVRELVIGYANNTVAARKIVLVWIIQSPEHLEWIRPWMTEILAMDKRRDVLRVMLFVSRPRSTKEIHSPSATVQMFPGRPNIDTLLGIEMENQVGTVGVTVCGPGALSDEVRRAVRQRQYQGAIEFMEEAFSW